MHLLQNTLRSLSEQTYKKWGFIFVDYGSDGGPDEALATMVSKTNNGQYIYCDSRGRAWNKAHAINIGAKFSASQYLALIDADMILSSTVLMEMMSCMKPDRCISARFLKLPIGVKNLRIIEDANRGHFGVSELNASGAIQILPREVFTTLYGLDETYHMWGCEDVDFTRRLIGFGLTFMWANTSPIYHQWHKPVKDTVPSAWFDYMNWHYATNFYKLQRNTGRWGKLLNTSERLSRNLELCTQILTYPKRSTWNLGPLSFNYPELRRYAGAYMLRSLVSKAIGGRPGDLIRSTIIKHPGDKAKTLILRMMFHSRFPTVAGQRYWDPYSEIFSITLTLFVRGLLDDYYVEKDGANTHFWWRLAGCKSHLLRHQPDTYTQRQEWLHQ